jgi:hypothetical protein
MISNAVNAGRKLTRSSTFWASLLFPALKVAASTYLGIDVPWEVVLAGIGAQGIRNAAEHVSTGMQEAASAHAGAREHGNAIVGAAVQGALGALLGGQAPSPSTTSKNS